MIAMGISSLCLMMASLAATQIPEPGKIQGHFSLIGNCWDGDTGKIDVIGLKQIG